MSEHECTSHNKGEIVPIIAQLSSEVLLKFNILSAYCEIRKIDGKFVGNFNAEVNNNSKLVMFAWDTSSFDSNHYTFKFWINIDVNFDSIVDYKITSETIYKYLKSPIGT